MTELRYTRFFDSFGISDVPLVGGKNASLGKMYSKLAAEGVRVPNGFATTAEAYRHMLDAAGATEALHGALDGFDPNDMSDLHRRSRHAREIVYGAGLPAEVASEIVAGYRRLQEQDGEEVSLAVRSSATAEDLPTASFAGQQETYLNVEGDESLLEACRRCYASLFTDRAVHYRIDEGFDHFKVAFSIGVMKMVRSDLASSGVMFTLDTESGFEGVVFVTGSWGLGENVVQGAVDPDEFYVHKPTFAEGHRAVLRRRLGDKAVKMVFVEGETKHTTRNIPTPKADRARFCLSDSDVFELAAAAIAIERHYGRPMDIEWAKDGIDQELYIVQARPETVASQRSVATIETYVLEGSAEILAEGRAVGEKIASGAAHVLENLAHLQEFRPGEVLVADTTTPDWEPVMKSASAIVTNRGGRTCHAAIVARELGVPAVVGSANATTVLGDGQAVTVSCAEGDTGRVYRGEVPFHVERTEVADLPRPATRIMVNLGDPDQAFRTSFLPNDGVGLTRMEFVVSESIKAHPMAILHPERIADPEARQAIARLTQGYADGAAFFVERLSAGIGTIAAAFCPKPVVVRMSHFKTNEYASLLGGAGFEPEEDNPMLGFRGASRYGHPAYAEGFALECAAMRRVREEMGLANVVLMRLAVEGCRRNGIHSGLCGQAPSDYPDMAAYLVEIGIDSMSLNPDTVLSTTRGVLDVEGRLGRSPRPVEAVA